jgi:hypothetical protein
LLERCSFPGMKNNLPQPARIFSNWLLSVIQARMKQAVGAMLPRLQHAAR